MVLCSNPSKRHIGGGKVLLEGDDRHEVLHKIYNSYNDDVGKVILNLVIFMWKTAVAGKTVKHFLQKRQEGSRKYFQLVFL